MIKCPSCLAAQTATSKFCSECGAALSSGEVTLTHHVGPAPAEQSVQSSATDRSHHGRFVPGTKVAGRYRIVSLVGRGGMGEVYRADDLKLGHTVALKFLPKDLAQDPQRLEYFHSEVRLTRQISHPNICRVYDISEVDGQHFLSMEYIDGEDLKVLLRRIGRLPSDKGIQIAQQLCAGLAAAHDQGVLHRDLKPANIMIDGRGQVRITDFGLAQLEGEGQGEVAGTPAYMAPEQLAQGETTIQSDLYSLGLILYELFTGQQVHKGASLAELRSEHEQSSPSRPSRLIDDMDSAVERVILRCLAKDSHERPSSAKLVAAALPGGDPLAAALAAGETPSPAMIAAAGGSRGFSLALGGGLFAAICLLLALIPFTEDWLGTFRFGPAKDYEPAVLKKMAADLVGELGWDTNPADRVIGYEINSDNELEFWYRQSSQPLRPNLPHLWAPPSDWRVTATNPPPREPGMISLRLDASGRLLEFVAVPAHDVLAENETTPQWEQLFERVGLDLADFLPATTAQLSAAAVPPMYADTVVVWREQESSATSLPPVLMATRNGKLVQLQWQTETAELDRAGTNANNPNIPVVMMFTIAFAGVLAFRNLRLGRTDTQGALRCALYFLAIHLVLWAVAIHHTGWFTTDSMLAGSYLLYSVATAFRVWLFYVALEPYVRRLWPAVLIAWSRLLSGRLRDPLVGRELLIGCLFGIVCLLIRLPLELRGVYIHPDGLIGTNALIANILIAHQLGIVMGIAFMAILLICRMICRNTWLAAVAFTAWATLMFGSGQQAWSLWIVLIVTHASFAFIYIRVGLLSAITALIVFFALVFVPHTADVNAWYSASSKFVLAAVFLLSGYAFYTSSLADQINHSHRAADLP